ncbi:hypothetical protein J1G42_18230 [Cellulomonas sp. zg-ZUI222]|uniref:NUDIX hydrolase n=2 Tax=Cellulomonadaceae TaxID=85016 RepID=A0ABX8DCR6_9CELL|nr:MULTISPECIES: hypothetical protein [Cellulomonas]MBO0900410.1 hypothetical protein [Cellulomonas sp. zg-ZUI22]MBO0922760.1 hypothetical protein [Cellulomonas wangleii]MBO0926375.1 hypothetical protein [Cellulomonas wangleii]QVI64202.1 hypothetical protein KG103_09100 [Cellulomonas wangleii]
MDGTAVLVVVGVVLLALWLVWVRASRLDRLHRKVAASRAVVDAQLVRRATVASELATSGLLDPASSVVLGESVWESLTAAGAVDVPAGLLPPDVHEVLGAPDAPGEPVDRSQVESELTAALREILDDADEVAALATDPLGARLLGDLAAAWYRVQLARRFHNEAVAQTQRVRRSASVRLLRLAGHAPEPRTLELDDAWPHGLARPGESARPVPPEVGATGA